jgi:hypothetical protein
MKCIKCGSSLRSGAKFCAKCGTAQPSSPARADPAAHYVRCTSCGAMLRPAAKFCARCGAVQQATPPLPSPPAVAPRTQRRITPWVAIVGGGAVLLLCLGAVGLIVALSLGLFTPQSTTGTTSGSVGSEGGEIDGPGKVKVIIPPGALEKTAKIDIVEVVPSAGAPPDMVQVGSAYNLTLPEGTVYHKALEVVLPLQRETGTTDDQYAVYRWSGSEWQLLGGVIEGDTIRVQLGRHALDHPSASAAWKHKTVFAYPAQGGPQQFATFREISTGRYRTIAFVNMGDFHPWVIPWTWEPGEGTRRERWLPAYGGWHVGMPTDIHYHPYSWAWLRLPLGTYTSWCLEWWDDDQNEFFHFFLSETVTLDPNTCSFNDHLNRKCEMPRVDYVIPPGAGERGYCGDQPGEGAPAPTVTPIPLVSPTPIAGAPTPAPTSTPTPTPTAAPSSTPRPEIDLGEERRNEEGGYAYRVIPGYRLDKAFGFDTMTAPDADPDIGPIVALTGGTGKEQKGATARDMYDQFVENSKDSGLTVSPPREVTVGGVKGLEADLGGTAEGKSIGGRVVFVVVSDTQAFSMLGTAPLERWENEVEPLFDAVRDSVRFFEPSAASTPSEPTKTAADERDIVVTLTWQTTDDLELAVYDPRGNSISYLNPTSPEGGQLDQDANDDCATATTSPSETISWPAGTAPSGEYRVGVFNMSNCPGTEPIDFRVVVQVDGQTILDVVGTSYPTGEVPFYEFSR